MAEKLKSEQPENLEKLADLATSWKKGKGALKTRLEELRRTAKAETKPKPDAGAKS